MLTVIRDRSDAACMSLVQTLASPPLVATEAEGRLQTAEDVVALYLLGSLSPNTRSRCAASHLPLGGTVSRGQGTPHIPVPNIALAVWLR